MMKKNYLKPNCMTTPMRGLRLMEGSQRVVDKAVTTNGNVGWSREADYNDEGVASPRSVWDD